MIPGRSKGCVQGLAYPAPQAWREAVEVVAMDGFTGFKTAAAEEIPAAVAVMDPSTWCAWPATPSATAAAAFSRPPRPPRP
jgi:transposase